MQPQLLHSCNGDAERDGCEEVMTTNSMGSWKGQQHRRSSTTSITEVQIPMHRYEYIPDNMAAKDHNSV